MPKDHQCDVLAQIEKLKESLTSQLVNLERNILREVKVFRKEMETAGISQEAMDEAIVVYQENLKKLTIRQLKSQLKALKELEKELQQEEVPSLEKFSRQGLALYLS